MGGGNKKIAAPLVAAGFLLVIIATLAAASRDYDRHVADVVHIDEHRLHVVRRCNNRKYDPDIGMAGTCINRFKDGLLSGEYMKKVGWDTLCVCRGNAGEEDNNVFFRIHCSEAATADQRQEFINTVGGFMGRYCPNAAGAYLEYDHCYGRYEFHRF